MWCRVLLLHTLQPTLGRLTHDHKLKSVTKITDIRFQCVVANISSEVDRQKQTFIFKVIFIKQNETRNS